MVHMTEPTAASGDPYALAVSSSEDERLQRIADAVTRSINE